jgi:hypothetical protein
VPTADPPATEPRVIELPRFPDPRGNLTFIEGAAHIPFPIRRAYWIYDVPGGERRGGHAYRELQEFIVALSGSFDVVVDDAGGRRTFALNRSYLGLYVPGQWWRALENFSTNAVCLILASNEYDEADYIRDRGEFETLIEGRD